MLEILMICMCAAKTRGFWQKAFTSNQCCDLETMVSRLECTRVHFVQVSVLVSRPKKNLDNNTASNTPS